MRRRDFLALSLGTIASKRTAGRIDLWWAVAIPFASGGVLLTGLGAITEGVALDWSLRYAVALAWASLVGTALAWGLWFLLVRAGDTSRAASVIFFVPLVALLLGNLVLGEDLPASLLLGSALVIAGVWLSNRPARSGDKAAPQGRSGSPGRTSPHS